MLFVSFCLFNVATFKITFIAHMQNLILKKWYKWTYLQNQKESYGYGKQTYGYQRGNVEGRDKSGVSLIGRTSGPASHSSTKEPAPQWVPEVQSSRWFLWLSQQFYYLLAKSLQSCLTLCDPIDGSPPGSPVPGILQARTLEWVAIAFCNAWKWKVKVKSLSRVQLFTTPWTAAHQAPLPMGFSRQEDWSGDIYTTMCKIDS